ncbi:hypothetical protein TWF718_009098 [Orbilia javanica]|uniref:Uncharacterized protein n=1 Tax=Orbilia javanica TaxID=47235 RepID=A0AAN8MLQ4_9PEZI
MPDPKRVKLYFSDPIGPEDDEEDDEDVDAEESTDAEESVDVEDTIDAEDSSSDDEFEFDSRFANYGVARRLCKILLNDVLSGDCLSGSIAYSKCYTGAPNPGLAVVPHGILRLPLSRSDIETAVQAAGLSLAADGVLEIPRDSIEIRNPGWTKWVEKELLYDVVVKMGLVAKYDVKAVLRGVRVYSGAGRAQKVGFGNDDVGTLEVVVPSEFLGGGVVMSFRHGAEDVETGERSEYDTVVTAWYSDVTHHSKPVSDGYKVTLLYQLSAHATPKPFASRLFPAGGIIKAVRDIMTADEPVAYVLKSDYTLAELRSKKFVGPDATLVHHLTQAIEKVGGMSMYCGFLVTSYVSGGREIPDVAREEDLDEYDHVDFELDGIDLNFELGDMTHLAGFVRAFGDKFGPSMVEWDGPVLTVGPRLSEMEVEVDAESECGWEEYDEEEEIEKKHSSPCIFLFPTSAAKSLAQRTKESIDGHSSWIDVKAVINSIQLPPTRDPDYTAAVWEAVVEACLVSKHFTDADMVDAAGFLKDSLRGVSASDLVGVCDSLSSSIIPLAIDAENPGNKTSLSSYFYLDKAPSSGRPYHLVAQNFTRMLRLFPVEVSKLFLHKFGRLLGSKSLVPDENAALAIRLLFELMPKEQESRFAFLLRTIFIQHPSENFRKAIDAEIKSHSSPRILEIWNSLSFKIHGHIIDGIIKRFESNHEPSYAITDHQVAGYEPPGGKPPGKESRLQWQLTSYFKYLYELEDPESVKFIVQLMNAVKRGGYKQWVLENLSGVAREVKLLPEDSKLLRLQGDVVERFLSNYQSAVLNLSPGLKPPAAFSVALPRLPKCTRKTCSLCEPFNSFLASKTRDRFKLMNGQGEKKHFKEVFRDAGRKSNGLLDTTVPSSSTTGNFTFIAVKDSQSFQRTYDQEMEIFRSGLNARRELLGAIGVLVCDNGALAGVGNQPGPVADVEPRAGPQGVKRKISIVDLTD